MRKFEGVEDNLDGWYKEYFLSGIVDAFQKLIESYLR